jgi:type II secretory pathway pseudopilin PulG
VKIRALHTNSAFTLIEMMISAGLMTVVLTSAYFCLTAGLSGQRLIEQRSDAVQTARVALSLIAADLRSAIPLDPKLEFSGMHRTMEGTDADNIDFATRNYTPRNGREPDYCETSYYLMRDPQSPGFVLMRRRDPTPDPEPLDGGFKEEIARGIVGLRFEYYDGIEWFDTWGDLEGKYKGMTLPPSNTYGLPVAVKITLTLDPEARRGPKKPDEETKAPMTFQTTARIDLEPMFTRQANSSSNATDAGDANANANTSTEPQPQGGPQ